MKSLRRSGPGRRELELKRFELIQDFLVTQDLPNQAYVDSVSEDIPPALW